MKIVAIKCDCCKAISEQTSDQELRFCDTCHGAYMRGYSDGSKATSDGYDTVAKNALAVVNLCEWLSKEKPTLLGTDGLKMLNEILKDKKV